MTTPIRPRHNQIARLVADAFDIDNEDVLNAIRRSYGELRDFLSGEGPGHIFVFHQSRDGGGDADKHVSVGQKKGHLEVYFSAGDKLRSGKAVYFLRSSDSPIDLDKVSCVVLCCGSLVRGVSFNE